MPAPKELTALLSRYEPDVQAIALAARRAVIDAVGPCYETIFQVYKNNVISLLYGTTEKRMKDNVCLVVIYRDHVNLMFPRGVDMKDPRGLLEGAGKAMRHVKMKSVADTTRPGVRDLLKQGKKRPDLGKPVKPLKAIVTTMHKKKTPKPKPAPAWPRLF